MDHADWVQQQIPYAKPAAGKRRRDNTKGWAAAPDTLSEFQAKVFDILGMVYGGIYNAPIAWDAVRWRGHGHGIAVPVDAGGGFSTFDFARLTYFVFLCHEARIRGGIDLNGPRGFLLTFYPRTAGGSMAGRHPNLDEAVTAFRGYLPADHRIVFDRPAAEAPAEVAA